MKKIEPVLFGLAILAFAIKPLHLPGNTLFIMLALLAIFVFNLYCMVTASRSIPYILTSMSALLIMISILAHLKFFIIAGYLLDFAAFILILAITFSVRKRAYFTYLSTFTLVLVVLQCIILFTPKHKIYKWVSIDYNLEIENDFTSWDKYSWFLYMDNKFDESLEAHKKAVEIATETGDTALISSIKKHGVLIESKKWKHFHK